MATKIESQPAPPLEITSLHGETRTRPPRSGRAFGVALVALLATALVVAAAAMASDVAVGPGRFLVCALVVFWGGAAVFVSLNRPKEPLSWVMVAGAAVGAIAAMSAVEIGRTSGSHDALSAVLAASLALLPAIGLHLALGLPRGELVHPVRRGLTIAGYVSAIPLAISIYSQRPDVPIASLAVASGAAAVIGLVGYVRRCSGARTEQERARLQWVAWGVVVAAAITAAAAALNVLVSWPEEKRVARRSGAR